MSDGNPTEQVQEQNFDPTQYPTGEQLDAEYSKQMAQLGVLDYEERSLWARQAEIQARLDQIREAKGNIDGIVKKLEDTKRYVCSDEFRAALMKAQELVPSNFTDTSEESSESE